jgi:hypothetical protein
VSAGRVAPALAPLLLAAGAAALAVRVPDVAAQPETQVQEVTERSRLEVAPAGRPFVSLSIENSLGDVRIEGHDGSALVIETHKHAPDDASLDRLRVSLVPGTDGSVRINTAVDGGREARPVAKRAARVDLVVRAPRDLKFSARVGSGQLEVTGMDAGGEVDAASGAITLRNISGGVDATTISGPLTLTQVFGSVDAMSVDAAVKLDSIVGDSLVTSAHKGSINARRVRAKRVELTTTTGDVELEGEIAATGKVLVASFRGNLTVRLRGKSVLAVRAVGSKVDLGTAKTRVVKGVTLAEIGSGDEVAGVDLRTKHGVVAFSVDW